MNVVINRKENEAKVLEIFVDGEKWKEVDASLFPSQVFLLSYANLKELEDHFNELEFRIAKNYAFRRLAAKSYFSVELTRKLQEKKISSSTISAVIKECQKFGFLNDPEWMKSFISSQISKGNGPQMIQKKLLLKGVKSDQAKAVIQGMQTEGLQLEKIDKLILKLSRRRSFNDPKHKRNAIAALRRKGFSFSLIQEALKNFKEHGDWDEFSCI